MSSREKRVKRSLYRCFGKRIWDIIMLLVMCPIVVPLACLIASFVRWKLGSPVLFRQERPGLLGRPFIMFKFRTMRSSLDKNGKLCSDKERISSFGKKLRSTSLDELPEVINVIRGDMSLVGPRPLLMKYLPRYSKEQARRHEIRPGITGWAQVNGRNQIAWEEKFRLDVWYVDNVSLFLDLRILWMTIFKTVKRDGISKEGHFSSPEFMGATDSSAESHVTSE